MDAADRDYLIRTVIGEAANEPETGQAAVAHVVLNRLASGKWGDNARSVVLAPSQFEPWGTRRNELLGIDPNSPAYQNAARIVDGVLTGQIADPTGGMTHFLNPEVTRQRFGSVPRWAQGQAIRIGQHDFYAPEGFVSRPETALDAINKAAPVASDLSGAGVQPLAFNESPKAPAMPQPAPAASSDDDILKLYTKKGVQVPAAASSGPVSDDDLLKLYSKPEALVAQGNPVGGKPMDANSGKFNAAVSFGNGVLQGAGVPLMAAAAAAKEKFLGAGGDFGNLFDQAKSVYAGNRAQYAAENPLTSALTEGGGSVASTIPAMIAAGPVVAGAARGVGVSAPVVDFLAGAGGGNALMRGVSRGVGGAIQGGAGSVMASGLGEGSVKDQGLAGALVGGAAGVVAPAVGKIGTALAGEVIDPFTAALAKKAGELGIPLRGSQISASPFMNKLDQMVGKMPFSGRGAMDAAQQAGVNRAVANTFGENVDRVTPEVWQAAKKRIGNVFDTVASQTTAKIDQQAGQELLRAVNEANQVLPASEMAPIKAQLQNILSKLGPSNELSGETYQALTRKGAPLDRAMNSGDPNIRYYAGQIRDALDGALERSATPEMSAALRQARQQYKALMTVKDLVAESPGGNINANKLLSKVNKNYDMGFGDGGPLRPIAEVGRQFLRPPADSGTPLGNRVISMLTSPEAIATGLVGAINGGGYYYGLSPEQMGLMAAASGAGMIGSGVTSRAVNALLSNPVYRNRLIERGLGGQPGVAATVGRAVGPYLPGAAGVGGRNLLLNAGAAP